MSQYGNYKSDRLEKAIEEMEMHTICTSLIIKSRWASWLPFGWMHSLAASYYARKARRLYNAKQLANALMKINGYKP